MADAKQRLPKITSPKGRLGFPKLVEPDYGNQQYPKPDGEFSTKLVVNADDPAVKAFIEKLQPFFDTAEDEAKEKFAALKAETRKKLGSYKMNPLFTELLDKETEEPTGEIEFKFARKASGEYKKGPKAGKRWQATVPLFDAKGRLIPTHDKNGDVRPDAPKVWGGTLARVSFEPSAYFIPGTGAAGLKLNLEAVQIIELGGGARSASSYGFGAEDGYAHEEDNESGGRFSDEEGDEGTSGATQTPDF
ncbi:MAG TPA: hypothetical protein VNR89_03955 [Roseomonas sp.]|nr:hypothetical protein [Roseomonas sp.]